MTTTDPTQSTVAWFHCFAGIAGDMALGSLIDAGADPDTIVKMLSLLDITGWDLTVETVLRGGLSCRRAVVQVTDDGRARNHGDIAELVIGAELPPRVSARALRVFDVLAETEGRLHGVPPHDVHFHEVGGHDAVIDVVGTAIGLELLGVDEIFASNVATGTGMVRAAHGLLPNPSPAVVRLLEGVPTYGRDTGVELTTPTGAAILAALASGFGPMPAMTVTSSGFGAGSNELSDLPNCTQVVIGHRGIAAGAGADDGQPVVLIEANVDDATGEQLSHAVALLIESGAHDAWISAVTMKKGRPGHVVHVLADPSRLDLVRRVLRSSTGTFGVRATTMQRWPAARTMATVTVEGMAVRMKVSADRAKPEFDDVRAVAEHTGLTTRDVASRAEQAWREQLSTEESPR